MKAILFLLLMLLPLSAQPYYSFQRAIACTATGADNLVCSPNPPLMAYSDLVPANGVPRVLVRLNAAGNNTGAVTLDISGKGPKAVVKYVNGAAQPLAANDLRAGATYELLYDGTAFQVISLLGNSAPAASAYQSVQNNGSGVTARGSLNLIPGSNVTLNVADDSVNNRTNVTISSTATASSGAGSIIGGAGALFPANSTTYTSPFDRETPSTSEASRTLLMPRAGTISRLRVRINSPGTGTMTFTIRINGVDTGVSCSATDAVSNCYSGDLQSATFNGGDTISLKTVSTRSSGQYTYWSAVVE